VVWGVNRRGWRARQGARGENQTRFPARAHDVAVAMGTILGFRRQFERIGRELVANAPARAPRWRHRRPNHRSAGKLKVAQEEVGPPDAVNTGGPVPLIKILAGKGGFAGQVRRRLDPSVRPVRRNAIPSLT
jgi:hypothetical protein